MKSSPTWDDMAIRAALALKGLLIDSEFCFFLNSFAILVRVGILYNAFQSHLIDGATAESHVSGFCDAVSYIRRNISFKGDEGYSRRGKTGLILTSADRECCDVLAIHLPIACVANILGHSHYCILLTLLSITTIFPQIC